jgi:hypothetical protein
MITVSQYDQVQRLLGRKGRPRLKKHVFAFSGMIRCGECGSMITAEEKRQVICSHCKYKFSYLNRETCPRCESKINEMKEPVFLYYVYYRCAKRKNPKCSQKYIKMEDLEKQINQALVKFQISVRFKDLALRLLRDYYRKSSAVQENIVESLSKSYNDVQARLTNLLNLKLSPLNTGGNLLSDEEYVQQKELLMQEKHRIEEKLRDQGQSFEDWMTLCEKAFNFAAHARCWFYEGDWEAKRMILSSLGSNLILLNKKVTINLENPLLVAIEKAVKTTPEASPDFAVFEPEKALVFSGRNEDLDSKFPDLLRGLNDVRTLWVLSSEQWIFEVYAPEDHKVRIAA